MVGNLTPVPSASESAKTADAETTQAASGSGNTQEGTRNLWLYRKKSFKLLTHLCRVS